MSSFRVSSVMKFLEKSNRISEFSASFLKVRLNFSKRYMGLDNGCIGLSVSYLGVLLEVLLEDNVLSKLLVVVLERRPGAEVRGLCEARHVELQGWKGGVSTQ
jgi:hypothetical protein